MSFLQLKVTSKIYNCELNIERRVTYIRGNSATGKTGLMDTIERYQRGNSSIKIECPRRVILGNNIAYLDMFKGYSNSIVFIDDMIITEFKEFAEEIMQILLKYDIYLVVINRVDSDIEEDSSNVVLSYSISDILICHKDGVNHWFTRLVDDPSFYGSGVYNNKYDCIVVEDTYGSNDLCSSIFNIPVISSNGNGNIIKTIKKATSQGYKSIFLFVDTAAFGLHFSRFEKYLKRRKDVNVSADLNYECFEYLLLMSNMLKEDFHFNQEKANSYPTWENYCEAELERLTFGRHYKYIHGREVRYCYFKDCDSEETCNEYIANKCDKRVDGDKIVNLFKDTIFDYMVTLRDDSRKGN